MCAYSIVLFGNCGISGINSVNKRKILQVAVILTAEPGRDFVAVASWLASSKQGIRTLPLSMATEHKERTTGSLI